MSRLAGMQIGTKARALVAALALGGALLSLAPGEAEAARRRDNGVRCVIEHTDGMFEFFMPGETFYFPGMGYAWCGNDGWWGPQERAMPEERAGSGRSRGGRGGR
jgi:hypothetical protein